jgi:signal transduction histidine kinase
MRSCDDFFKPEEIDAPFSQTIPLPGQRRKLMVRLANERLASLSVSGASLSHAEVGEDLTAVVFRDVTETDLVHHLLGHFIANVVHEFRTPLAALNASIELLLDQYEPGERQELVKGLQVSVINLQTLVDNLLESASFEAGHFRVSPRPYDLSDLVSEAVRIMRPLLEKYDQQLLVKMPAGLPLVKADPRRTVQVLVNLLSNASKYGPADMEIVLSANVEEDCVRVRVVDRGPGIPPEQQENLFRRFVNPEPRHLTRQEPRQATLKVGAGLGLSVVKAIVEAQGGEVGVENLRWGGTTFWFTIPIATEI